MAEYTTMPFDELKLFKETLAGVRLKLNAAIARKKEFLAEIKNLIEQRNEVIELFRAEVIQAYPDLAGKSRKEILQLADAHHPIVNLYQKYHQKIQSSQGAIISKTKQYQTLAKQVEEFEVEQFSIVDAYGQYAATSVVPVPSVEEISADIVKPLESSVEEETKVLSDVSILSDLNEDTVDALLLQQAESEPIELQAQVPVPEALKEEATGLGKVWTVAGILALAYIFIGG